MTATVAIVQRRLVHYREPLFERLREVLAARGITLRVLHGRPSAAEVKRGDEGRLPWAEALPTRHLFDGRVCWMPFADRVRDCALVVLPQENRLAHNLPWLLRPPKHMRTAFWGHGADLQTRRAHGAGEWMKRRLLPRVDWWFAYSRLSAERVLGAGYPADRVTTLDNTIDVATLQIEVAAARSEGRAALRAALGLPDGDGPVGLYLGALADDKAIPLLLDMAARLRAQAQSFQLLIGGDGPLAPQVRSAAGRADAAVVWLGALRGRRKAQALAAADLMLYPGAIGLGVLDAFAAGLPLLTRRGSCRAPESAYLQPGVNACIAEDDAQAFVAAAIRLLQDEDERRRLAAGAAASASRHGIGGMAMRFADGIEAALRAPPWVRRW
jgi:glycosyltransferase involved in cell wall biosynthesis